MAAPVDGTAGDSASGSHGLWDSILSLGRAIPPVPWTRVHGLGCSLHVSASRPFAHTSPHFFCVLLLSFLPLSTASHPLSSTSAPGTLQHLWTGETALLDWTCMCLPSWVVHACVCPPGLDMRVSALLDCSCMSLPSWVGHACVCPPGLDMHVSGPAVPPP